MKWGIRVTRKIDRRVARTKETLTNAFIQLVKDKGYSHVTVKDIVDFADYNRTTFYVHFESKEDLAKELLQNKLTEFAIEFKKPLDVINVIYLENLLPNSISVFNYIQTNQTFFDLLKFENSIPGLRDEMLNIILHLFVEKIQFQSVHDLDVNDSYFTNFRSYGVYGIILEWVKSNYLASPIELSQKLIQVLYAPSSIAVKID